MRAWQSCPFVHLENPEQLWFQSHNLVFTLIATTSCQTSLSDCDTAELASRVHYQHHSLPPSLTATRFWTLRLRPIGWVGDLIPKPSCTRIWYLYHSADSPFGAGLIQPLFNNTRRQKLTLFWVLIFFQSLSDAISLRTILTMFSAIIYIYGLML